MDAAPPDATRRLFDRFGWPTAHMLFLAALAVGFAVPPVVSAVTHPERNKDYPLWYTAGLIVREGKPLYPEDVGHEFPYMYPPTAAIFLFAPLSYLGPVGFVTVSCLVNAAAWFGCLVLAAPFAAGRWRDVNPLLYVVPAFATVAYVYDSFLLGQINVALLFLLLGSAHCLRANRGWSAGALLGVAAAIKVFPLPVVAYFVVRKKWVAVVSTFLTLATVWVILPAPVRGFGRNLHELKVWAGGMLGDQSGETVAQRSDTGFTFHNQGLVSVTHRLLRPVSAGCEHRPPLLVNVAAVPPGTAQAVGIGLCLLLGGMILIAGGGRFARTPTAEAAEWGMVLTLAVLCSPLSWTYFFCWLMPAWAAVARFLTDPSVGRTDRARVGAIAAVAMLLLAVAVSEQIDPTVQAYGATCWGGVVLFLGCGLVVRCERKRVDGESDRAVASSIPGTAEKRAWRTTDRDLWLTVLSRLIPSSIARPVGLRSRP
jgi:hypothetical protein